MGPSSSLRDFLPSILRNYAVFHGVITVVCTTLAVAL